ncbi:MAG: DUF2301 domain-containing membrane protein [Fibrobacterales bacterium]
MANPEHLPEMHSFDKMTVSLYRIGLVIVGLSSLIYSVEFFAEWSILGDWYLPIVAMGAALASANIHLYDPRFRWLIPLMSWIGLVIFGISTRIDNVWFHEHAELAALGFFYAGTGMMAFKEYFCFKIPGLPFVPFLFAFAIGAFLFSFDTAAYLAVGIASLLYSWLAVAKWTMPLHYDIGDKDQYGV